MKSVGVAHVASHAREDGEARTRARPESAKDGCGRGSRDRTVREMAAELELPVADAADGMARVRALVTRILSA